MSGDLGVIIAGAIGPFGGTQPPAIRRSIGDIVANITVEERHTDELQITTHPVESGAPITDHAFKRPAELTLRLGWSNSVPQQTSSLFGGIAGNLASALGNAAAGSVQAQLSSGAARAIGGSAIGNLAVGQLSNIFGSATVAIGAAFNTGTGRGTTRVQDIYQQLLDLQSSAVPFTIYTGKRKYESMLMKSVTIETDVRTENSLSVVMVCQQIIIVYTTVQAVQAPADAQEAPQDTAAVQETGTKQAIPVNPDTNGTLANGIQDYVEPFSAPFNELTEVTTVNAEGFIPE